MNAKIFMNYRKDDSPWNSLALYQELIKHFPKSNIFKDFNTISPGVDFEESIENALESCDVLLVLISNQWLNITDANGNRRINNENDYVHLEIATALKRNICVIPVLFDDAALPAADELPVDLKKLTRRQFIEIDKTRFEADTTKLVEAIKAQLKPTPFIKYSILKYILIAVSIVAIAAILLIIYKEKPPHPEPLPRPKTAIVVTNDFLALKVAPDINSKRVLKINNSEVIQIISQTSTCETIESIYDCWYKISYNGTEGYVFGGYLHLQN